MSNNKSLYTMPKGDLYTLICLLLYTIITFVSLSTKATFSGVAVFGWLMGLFMFAAPIFGLVCMKFDEYDQQQNKTSNISK